MTGDKSAFQKAFQSYQTAQPGIHRLLHTVRLLVWSTPQILSGCCRLLPDITEYGVFLLCPEDLHGVAASQPSGQAEHSPYRQPIKIVYTLSRTLPVLPISFLSCLVY